MKLTEDDSVRDIDAAMRTADAFAHVLRTTIVASFTIDDDEGIKEVMERVAREFTVSDHPFDAVRLADFLSNNIEFALNGLMHLKEDMFNECMEIAGEGLDKLNPQDFIIDKEEE